MQMKSLVLFTVTTAALLTVAGCSEKTSTGGDLDAFADTANADTLAADAGDVAVNRDVPASDVDAFAQPDSHGDTGGDESPPTVPYPIVDTNQMRCYNAAATMTCEAAGQPFFGQDSQYQGYQPRYLDNGDGTVTDLVTGLMWQKDPGEKVSWKMAMDGVATANLAGYSDWRVPTIKELYSLIMFSGVDPKVEGSDTSGLIPFINTDFFAFEYGDTSAGQRVIDSQWVTSSVYVFTVMGEMGCFFGVNFADGRIKCYPTAEIPNQAFFAIYVRDAVDYGKNDFVDNGDDTILDRATGLMWQKADSEVGMKWVDALAYCEGLSVADQTDWRLPNAKELQSIVDYTRSPDTTDSAAIDPKFVCSSITNEAGVADYPFYWTSTTHAKPDIGHEGEHASYVAFGRALGYFMEAWIDVHGAGAQRSDPKDGDPADYPTGFGPQGDAIRILNYVRCVRDGATQEDPDVVEDMDVIEDVQDPPDVDIRPDGGPDGDVPPGPVSCTIEADCGQQGACPQGATKGCTCATTPDGKLCVPLCSTDNDCPQPPGQTLTCAEEGICIPDRP